MMRFNRLRLFLKSKFLTLFLIVLAVIQIVFCVGYFLLPPDKVAKVLNLTYAGLENSIANVLFSINYDPGLPVYEIDIDEDKWLDLIDIPNDPYMEYEKMKFKLDGKKYKAKIKFRGDNKWHWAYPQKSLKINLRGDELINMSEVFNLVNPKTRIMVTDPLSNWLAKRMGLLAPDNYFVNVKINDQPYGLYYYLDQLDENFLRKFDKLPSNIYGGDISKFNILWHDSSLWEKKAVLNTTNANQRFDIDNFIAAVNTKGDFREEIEKILDVDKALKYYVHAQIMGRIRFDNHHNHKYYFDPSKGKMEPIVWDTFGESSVLAPVLDIDLVPNSLFAGIFKYPEYVEKRNLILWNSLENEASYKEIIKKIDEYYDEIKMAVIMDKYKDYVDVLEEGWPSVAYSGFDFMSDIEIFKEYFELKDKFFRNDLNNGWVRFYYFPAEKRLRVLVYGQSGVVLNNIGALKMVRDVNANGISDEGETLLNDEETLYPGRKSVPTSGVNNPKYPYLKYTYKPTFLIYDFVIQNEDNVDIKNSLKVVNHVTGVDIDPKYIEVQDVKSILDLKHDDALVSIHPWKMKKNEAKKIVLEGNTILTEDFVIDENDSLEIKPGTVIRFNPGVSIFSYGKVNALGTKDQPIKFLSATNEPWGVFALQGDGSRDSEFRNCYFEKGSHGWYENVHYTGMVSVYNGAAVFDSCTFKDNKIEDDTFNGKQSRIDILNSTFIDARSDAVDFDFTEGTIKGNSFINSGNDAIDIMTSTPLIESNNIEGSGDKGISIGEGSKPYVVNNTIENCNIGIEIKDTSDPVINKNTVLDNNIGINAYHKNFRYPSGGRGIVIDSVFAGNEKEIVMDDESELKLFGGETEKKYKGGGDNVDVVDEIDEKYLEVMMN